MLIHRVLLGVFTVVAIAVLVYAATLVLPGDAAQAILGQQATPQRLALLNHQLGLNQPLVSRFLSWAGHAIRGQFGTSLDSSVSVTALIGPKMANSAALVVVTAVLSTFIGMGLGLLAAVRRDGVFDSVSSVISLIANALPEFVVAIFVVMLLSLNVFHWFPSVSFLIPGTYIWQSPNKLVLPVITLVVVTVPYVFRMTRGAMIEALNSDYVESAMLRGVSRRQLALRHALPNALPPVIQVTGLNLLYLAGGIVLVETVFGFPGVGSALVQAITGRDVPVIQFIVLVLALFYVVLNILTDVIVMMVTPRKRYPR
jgi:peptide/nickel transport system permease protein